MIYQATTVIANALKAHGLQCSVEETTSFSYVKVGFSGDNAKNVSVHFISSDQDNDVAARVFDFITFEPEKKAAVVLAISELNSTFRFLKFTMDKDNSVTVAYDFPEKCKELGEIAMETVAHFYSILDKAYPVLMKAVWG